MTINITVAYANPQRQVEIPCRVTEDTTVALAIRRSGILAQFADIELPTAVIGIYSRRVHLDDVLEEGDRIEIYRPLLIDPKDARRLRIERSS